MNPQPAAANGIPVIDITRLSRGEDCPETAKALRDASQDPGFIYVQNHGVAADVIRDARASARAFFEGPDETKRTVLVSSHHRGWLPIGGARMDDDTPPDLKESFIWGHPPGDEQTRDHSLRGPNQWPAQSRAEFREHAMRWLSSAEQLARQLLRAFANSLGLPAGFFLRTSDRPLSRASFVYYPPQPPGTGAGAGQFGVGPHTDFGLLTVLCQDDVGGLQIENCQGQWVDAPPIDGTLIINVGDLLARWTNAAFRSARHRVLNRSSQHRLSLVLAYDPNPETVIDAAQIQSPSGGHPEPITCGDYLDQRFAKAFSYRAP